MSKVLVVVDMQNDFLTGALANKEGVEVIQYVKNSVEEAINKGYQVIFTRDTHQENYLETEEGINLPVTHCIENTKGWEIVDDLKEYTDDIKPSSQVGVFDKETFGSIDLANYLKKTSNQYEAINLEPIDEITLMGVCTDICVISNAVMVKAALPYAKVNVDVKGCAGVTPESHDTAISAMKALQIHILNENSESWRK